MQENLASSAADILQPRSDTGAGDGGQAQSFAPVLLNVGMDDTPEDIPPVLAGGPCSAVLRKNSLNAQTRDITHMVGVDLEGMCAPFVGPLPLGDVAYYNNGHTSNEESSLAPSHAHRKSHASHKKRWVQWGKLCALFQSCPSALTRIG
ncbi:unnamed protein product [Calypogeia fissa]